MTPNLNIKPDIKLSVKQTFGIDSEMEVDAFSKKKKPLVRFYPPEELIDDIEEALWEIKEQYDLETEEVLKTVATKRENLSYLRKQLKNKRS